MNSLKIGFFLAVRELRRANIWTTILIVAIMVLTFLNLVVVSGVLEGLIQGSVNQNESLYIGDIILTNLNDKPFIDNDHALLPYIYSKPEVSLVSERFLTGAKLQANYKMQKNPIDIVNTAGGQLMGIDPEKEEAFGHISKHLIEGSFITPGEIDQIVIGANLLYKYTPIDSSDMQTLKNVGVGSKLRLIVGTTTREVTIKGIIKSKVDAFDQRIIMDKAEFKKLANRYEEYPNEIAIKLISEQKASSSVALFKQDLLNHGAGVIAKVQTADEAEPKFVKDIQATFGILGNMIGSIGLAVAAITIFIIIFVNAITRRRYIGILKGIGINSTAIEISYVIQSLFYAICGMVLGSLIVFGLLKPYLDIHPIDFPFSNGILVATLLGTLTRVFILFIATLIAGYIPARIVTKQNTLDAILGR